MAIITYNNGLSPMPLRKAITASPNTPTRITDPTSVSVQPSNVASTGTIKIANYNPEQIIGLVPVFKCCNAKRICVARFLFAHTNTISAILRITLNGSPLGIITALTLPPQGASSDAALQAALQAIFPTGYTVSVSSTSNLNRWIVITQVIEEAPYDCSDLGVDITNGTMLSFQDFQATSSNYDPCERTCECQNYPADYIQNPQDFALPVFAAIAGDVNPDACYDSYQNDINTFLFNFPTNFSPIMSNEFSLEKWDGTEWDTVAYLNDNTYGEAYYNNFFPTAADGTCTNVNYQGYKIAWQNVLNSLGEGLYRLKLENNEGYYCYVSPPFCLRPYDCIVADGTVKFEAFYEGGSFGSVTKQGLTYKLCCINPFATDKITTLPITLSDSIRFFGFFGREQYEHKRDQIKYATGEIKKVRDEMIKTFDLRSDRVPLWLHQRFAAYGMMADKLFVNDYNRNNANYNYKHFWVVGDSGYTIDHKNYSRYSKIQDVKFKEGLELIYKDTCC